MSHRHGQRRPVVPDLNTTPHGVSTGGSTTGLLALLAYFSVCMVVITLFAVFVYPAASKGEERQKEDNRASWTVAYWAKQAPEGCRVWALTIDPHDRRRGAPIFVCEGAR